MAFAPTQSQAKKLIRTAMQSQAPTMFRELSASGTLEAELNSRARMYWESMVQASGDATHRILAMDPEPKFDRKVGLIEQGKREAIAMAPAAALDFPDETDDQDAPA